MQGQPKKPADFVDPFIGTAGHGHTFPGAATPFGMVQLSPDNGTEGWDWCSGYHYSDSLIAGFSHTHLSGTGIGDLCDISVMPAINKNPVTDKLVSRFSHNTEKASPGYYSVDLSDYSIHTELSVTARCGIHKYTFPASDNALIQLNLGFAINWDKPFDCGLTQLDDSTFTGYRRSTGWAKDQAVFFALRLSAPVSSIEYTDTNNISHAFNENASSKNLKAWFNFSTHKNQVVYLKVGISMTSEENAVNNLSEIPGWNFEKVKHDAADLWNTELSKVQAEFFDEKDKTIFYTAYYHTMMAPALYTDGDGSIRFTGNKIIKQSSPVYTVHSLWDTFRAQNPWLTITHKSKVPDVINSYLVYYRQYGLLPVWDLQFNETNTMTGYHAVSVIADAILKNIKGFDWKEAYQAMKKSSMQNIRGTDSYRKYGFVPHDKQGWSVTITLEYAFDDWCIAQSARKLGLKDDYDYYIKRSQSYRDLFDARTGFFRAKNSDGKWVEPFDPYLSEHGFNGQYIEGTAWQHTWFVPHDVKGMMELHGGKSQFITKLDSLWTVSSVMTGDNVSADVSGLIGQYAHGNEPSHHIAYLYNYAGQQWKSALHARQIAKAMYSEKPGGLSGNEDCGQMSAWYLFSALGFYPVNPNSGEYAFGSPLIHKARIHTSNDKTFQITVSNNSATNKYIQQVILNGKTLTSAFLKHGELEKGGKLIIIMGPKPSLFGSASPVGKN